MRQVVSIRYTLFDEAQSNIEVEISLEIRERRYAANALATVPAVGAEIFFRNTDRLQQIV